MQKVMSVLTFLSYEYKLVFLAVFVQRPRPNYEKPATMQNTPTYILAGRDGRLDVVILKSSSLCDD